MTPVMGQGDCKREPRKYLPGPPAQVPEKVSKTVQKQSKETLQTLSGDSPETSQTFGDFMGSHGRRPRETFSRLSAFRAWRARETPYTTCDHRTPNDSLSPKGPRHTKNSMRSQCTICSEFTTRSDSHYRKCSDIYYVLRSESLCVANSLHSSGFYYGIGLRTKNSTVLWADIPCITPTPFAGGDR